MIDTATALLEAFARSDLGVIDRLCTDDVLLWGTDHGESWSGKAEVLEAFAGTFDLGVRWLEQPRTGDGWVAGLVEFTVDGTPVEARVTMAFEAGFLAHAHYSVAAPPAT